MNSRSGTVSRIARLEPDRLGGDVGLLPHGDDGCLQRVGGQRRAGVGGVEVGGDDPGVQVVDGVEQRVSIVDVAEVWSEQVVDELGQGEGGGDGQLLRDLLDGVEIVVDDGLAGDLDQVAALGGRVGGPGIGQGERGVGGILGDG